MVGCSLTVQKIPGSESALFRWMKKSPCSPSSKWVQDSLQSWGRLRWRRKRRWALPFTCHAHWNSVTLTSISPTPTGYWTYLYLYLVHILFSVHTFTLARFLLGTTTWCTSVSSCIPDEQRFYLLFLLLLLIYISLLCRNVSRKCQCIQVTLTTVC